MQPYNYNVQQIDPFGSALKGMQTGMAFNQMKAQQVAQKQQMANQARIQGELADLSSDFSYDSLLKFSLRNPEYVKQFEKLYEPMSLREKEESFKDASRMYALSLSNPEAAIIELDNRSKVFAESGDEEQARLFKGLADGARQNPGSLSTSIGMFLYGADSDKFAEMQDKLSGAKLKSAQAKKTEKEAEKIEREALKPSARYSDKVNVLLRGIDKELQVSDRQLRVLGDLKDTMPEFTGGELAKKYRETERFLTGGDPKYKAWFQKFEGFKIPQVLKARPPGNLTEKEGEWLKGAAPGPDATVEEVKLYLDFTEKLESFFYGKKKLEAEWLKVDESLSGLDDVSGVEFFGHKPKKDESLSGFLRRIGDEAIQSIGARRPSGKSDRLNNLATPTNNLLIGEENNFSPSANIEPKNKGRADKFSSRFGF